MASAAQVLVDRVRAEARPLEERGQPRARARARRPARPPGARGTRAAPRWLAAPSPTLVERRLHARIGCQHGGPRVGRDGGGRGGIAGARGDRGARLGPGAAAAGARAGARTPARPTRPAAIPAASAATSVVWSAPRSPGLPASLSWRRAPVAPRPVVALAGPGPAYMAMTAAARRIECRQRQRAGADRCRPPPARRRSFGPTTARPSAADRTSPTPTTNSSGPVGSAGAASPPSTAAATRRRRPAAGRAPRRRRGGAVPRALIAPPASRLGARSAAEPLALRPTPPTCAAPPAGAPSASDREQVERGVQQHRVVGEDLVEGEQVLAQGRLADRPQLDAHRLVAADDRAAGARELPSSPSSRIGSAAPPRRPASRAPLARGAARHPAPPRRPASPGATGARGAASR